MPGNLDIETLDLPYYDGAGNDFFLYDARVLPADAHFAELARRICDRSGSFGGADGLLVLSESRRADADVQMRIFNADGSEPEMCGNGARCVVRYLLEDAGERVVLDTVAGPIEGRVLSRAEPFTVEISIGEPRFRAADIGIDSPQIGPDDEVTGATLQLDGTTFTFDAISFGNPHIVIFTDDVDLIDVAQLGPKLERAPLFTHGTNVHFATVLDAYTLRVRHWERGAGATAACGTGTAAVAVAAIRRSLVASPVRVFVPGGELGVTWNGGVAELSGPATLHAVNG